MTNCSAKGKIVVENGDISTAKIYGKGQHDASFFPAIDPHIIRPDQKLQVVEAYTKYKPRPKTIANQTGLSRRQVNGIFQRLKKTTEQSDNPFESFKLILQQMKDSDCTVLLPIGLSYESLIPQNFIVLFVKEELITHEL